MKIPLSMDDEDRATKRGGFHDQRSSLPSYRLRDDDPSEVESMITPRVLRRRCAGNFPPFPRPAVHRGS